MDVTAQLELCLHEWTQIIANATSVCVVCVSVPTAEGINNQ